MGAKLLWRLIAGAPTCWGPKVLGRLSVVALKFWGLQSTWTHECCGAKVLGRLLAVAPKCWGAKVLAPLSVGAPKCQGA